ncbi:hypothetical protein [Candidatus Uabimicrobium sp. HlEnr_7]|uniref:hypothetical protein n=1 Tax=Candidatus Uabimicrobium helgolandensis TaxID=3095367 RepID=UPI0035580C6F
MIKKFLTKDLLVLSLILIISYLILTICVSDSPVWGDEPHYLLIAYSLAFDFDSNLHNNSFAQLDEYFFVHNSKNIKFHATPQTNSDKIYSRHEIGLPLLLAPVLRLASTTPFPRIIMLLFMNLLGYLTIINMYLLLRRYGKQSAFLVSIAVGLSAPMYFYSAQIFSDLVAALVILYSYRKIQDVMTINVGHFLWLGFILSFLPWLHIKYVPVTVFLYLYYGCQMKVHKGQMLAQFARITAAAVISAILLFVSFYYRFESFFPLAAWKGENYLDISIIPYSVIGTLLDTSKGLFVYAPFYFFSITALVFLRSIPNKIPLLCIFLLTQGINLLHPVWWGGFCPPGRYSLVAIFILAILLQVFINNAHKITCLVVYLSFALSIINTCIMLIMRKEDVPYMIWSWGKSEYTLSHFYDIYFLPNLIFQQGQQVDAGEIATSVEIFTMFLFVTAVVMVCERYNWQRNTEVQTLVDDSREST